MGAVFFLQKTQKKWDIPSHESRVKIKTFFRRNQSAGPPFVFEAVKMRWSFSRGAKSTAVLFRGSKNRAADFFPPFCKLRKGLGYMGRGFGSIPTGGIFLANMCECVIV